MSEEYARFKQYEYKTVCLQFESIIHERTLIYLQNSNLVLTSENRTSHNNEPTGEVESLRGRIHGKMGDRVAYAKPKELEDKLDKMRKKYPLEQCFISTLNKRNTYHNKHLIHYKDVPEKTKIHKMPQLKRRRFVLFVVTLFVFGSLL
jgi:hypothetical protein